MAAQRSILPAQFRSFAAAMVRVVPWLWLGIAVGISLIETPIRFRTPPITRDGAAMLGVAIFHALAYVELCLLVLLMAAAILLQGKALMIAVGGLGLIVGAEHAIVVPLLAVRAKLLLEGIQPEPSSVHAWATAFEAAKMLLLVLIGWIGQRGSKEQ